MELNVVIVGLGLIGGSLAKAFQARSACAVCGLDSDAQVVQAAVDCGAIDHRAKAEDLKNADVIFLCLYPQACIDFVRENGKYFRPGCIVTDTCGIKREICTQLPSLAQEYGFCFFGGHPMAGKEQNGFEASDAALFDGASYIFVPCGAPQRTLDVMTALAVELGFGGTVVTTPERHDEMIAYTSQVPHALACAYVASPRCLNHRGFSAGSYRDVSRVARINETLWTELFLDNADPLVSELDTLVSNLKAIRDAVSARDGDTLRALLQQGRKTKERLGE